MAVDYSAGASDAIASGYESLRRALADRGTAENLAKQREIDRKGLFGSGIRTEDIRGLTETGLSIAEFGQKRMEGQMDRATKSYDRRKAADERRLATLQNRLDKGQLDKAGLAEMDGIQMGMTERRNKFEDTLAEYRGKGLWGTGFGGDEVGYRTEGESKWSRGERSKPGPGSVDAGPWDPGVSGTKDSSIEGSGRAPWEREERGGPPDRYSSYPHQREFENIAQETGGDGGMLGRHPFADNQESEFTTSKFPGRPGRGEQWDPSAGGGGSGGSAMGSGVGPGASGGGRTAEQRIPEAYLKDDIAPRSNKFEGGMMNTGESRHVPASDPYAPFETFKDAFKNARRQKGPGEVFEWRGKPYTTDYK